MTENLFYEPTPTEKSMRFLSEVYYTEAENLEVYIKKLREELKSRPEPQRAEDLKARIEILSVEKRELFATAGKLSKLAAPPPAHPSLLRREREAS